MTVKLVRAFGGYAAGATYDGSADEEVDLVAKGNAVWDIRGATPGGGPGNVLGVDTRYTAAQLTALADASGLTRYKVYVEYNTGKRWWSLTESTLEPFNWARIIGGDVRASLTTAKASIHAANGIISVGASLLVGIEVIAPGSADSTITIYDNASAASGRVLRKVYANDPSNVAGGWHDADGRNGIAAANGLYIALTGSTLPVVLAYFDGTYPAWTDWSGVQTWYFDSVAGSNSTGDGSIGNPYKEVYGHPVNFLGATDVQKICLFKAGQSHHYGRTVSGSTNMPGTNIKVRLARYGDASLPNPVLWMDVGDALNNNHCDATGGVFECSDIDWEYRTAFSGSASFTAAQVNAASGAPVLSAAFSGPTGSYMLRLYTSGVAQAHRRTNVTLTNGATTITWSGDTVPNITCDANFDWESSYRTGAAVSGTAGARIIIDGCRSSRFTNGFLLGSDDSRATRNSIRLAATGFFTDATVGHGTASRMLFHANSVPQGSVLKDAITLHDGETSDGFHSAITCNVLFPGEEQCVDLAADTVYKYKQTLVAHNYCYVDTNATGGIVADVGGDGTTMVGNEVTGSGTNGPSFMVRGPAVYVGNVTDRVISNAQGQLDMGDTTAAPGSVVLFNTLVTPAAGAARFSIKAGHAGTINCTCKFNLIVSQSNQRIVGVQDITGWSIDYNAYYYPAVTSGGAGLTANGFQHAGGGMAKAAWQALLAGACDANSTFQVNPSLVNTYQLQALSQFIAAGAAHPARYMLWSGPSWMDGPVSIGADEWQGNRRAP
jgi:hypothetical protein